MFVWNVNNAATVGVGFLVVMAILIWLGRAA